MSGHVTWFAGEIVNYLSVASVVLLVFTLLAWLLIKAAKIREPIYCYMIWLCLLIFVSVVPAIWLYGPKLPVAVLPAQVESAKVETQPEVGLRNLVSSDVKEVPVAKAHVTTHTNMESVVVAKATPSRSISIKSVVAGTWVIGFFFMLARLGVGWYRLHKFCLSVSPATNLQEKLQQCFSPLHNRFLKRNRILIGPEADGPVCFGIIRPVIILPRDIVCNSSPEEIKMIMNHELAHIKRHDNWVILFQRMIEAVFFFHPVIWYVSSRITQEREKICDNYVLAGGAAAKDYAGLLSRIAEQGLSSKSLQAVALYEGTLFSRVCSILDPKGCCRTKPSLLFLLVCLFVVTIFFGCSMLRLKAGDNDAAGISGSDALIKAVGNYEAAGHTQKKNIIKHDLLSVAFPTEKQGWACGRWGTILHTADGGKNWDQQKSGTDYTLISIFFIDPQKGWAVGDGGTIIHTDDGGKNWVKQECPVDYYLMGVCFIDEQKGWAVTEWSNILYTEDGGKNWQVQYSGTDCILKSVSFCDPLNGWATGEYGYIYHTSDGGRNWEHQAGSFGLSDEVFELINENTLSDIFSIDPMTAWAVGTDGYVTRTIDGGKHWQQIEGNFPKTQLFGVTSDRQGRIIIGGNRTLLTSLDGGKSFTVPEIKPHIKYGWIYGVAQRGSKGFAAVGKNGWIYLSDGKGMYWQR